MRFGGKSSVVAWKPTFTCTGNKNEIKFYKPNIVPMHVPDNTIPDHLPCQYTADLGAVCVEKKIVV